MEHQQYQGKFSKRFLYLLSVLKENIFIILHILLFLSHRCFVCKRLSFSLEMSRAAVVDVTVDDDLNIFTLALLGGRPHVMSCSLLTHGKRKVKTI